jgi:TolB-like protein/DNA-binding winged helix-turn-helix (wHTH) protein
MTQGDQTVRLEPRTLRLLLNLAARAGDVVSADELLADVWPGVIVTQDSVYQAIASLRRLLGRDPGEAPYIVTVPRRGYRLVAAVSSAEETPLAPPCELGSAAAAGSGQALAAGPVRRETALPTGVLALALLVLGLVLGLVAWRITASFSEGGSGRAGAGHAVAVLPFLDFTDDMSHEVFADGIAEEVIGRLSRVPGVQVPALSVSFQFKGSGASVGAIARKLGVDYVVDGSVRKSGTVLRIAARLTRADSGFILWSETYDSPAQDLLKIQDAVGGKIAEALAHAMAQEKGAPAKKTPPPGGG